jgi:sulfur-oxidizing protein SoxY
MERRVFLQGAALVFGSVVESSLLFPTGSLAAEENKENGFKELYASITKGKTVESGKIKITAPDQPENAAKTPFEIEVSYPMKDGDFISKIYVLAPENRVPKAIIASFSPKNGLAYLATDIRVGVTQEVIVLAETNKGKIFKATKPIKVTVAGCGA